MKRRIKILTSILAVLLLDQGIKILVKIYLEPIGHTEPLWGIVRLHYVENTGAAFSILSGATDILTILTGIILLVSLGLLMSNRLSNKLIQSCLCAITAGGAGNFIDRLFRGYVVDYIEPVFIRFAVFNFADCFVTVGAVVMIAYLCWDLVQESREEKRTSVPAEKNHD